MASLLSLRAATGSDWRRRFAFVVPVAILVGCLACRKSRSSADGHGTDKLATLDRSHPAAGVIVVLGSSTAAGVGASAEAFTWVSRYQTHLARDFPRVVVINLAVGGFTTYQIQPARYVPPRNRPQPDPKSNIDAALALLPSAIVVSLPSNDQAAGYDWGEQLTNYERVLAAATSANVPLWITTTQPRNFDTLQQRHELAKARALIAQRFAGYAPDFWTPLATRDDRLKHELDSGDGTHLNDAGHALLAQAMVAARIPETMLARGR